MIVSTKQLADFLDLSSRRVQELEKEEILEKEARNEWDLKKCFLAYLEYKIALSNESYGLSEARAKKEKADADIKELVLAEKKSQVIGIDKIEKDLIDIASTLSNKLYNLPHKLKMSVSIDEKTEDTINALIDEILHELKDTSIYTKYVNEQD